MIYETRRLSRAIVRVPSSNIHEGITSVDLGKPDYQKALVQHSAYVAALSAAGLKVHVLPPKEGFADSCFVEDVALLTPSCAIISRPAAPSRANEVLFDDMKEMLLRFYTSFREISAPGTLEPGDIINVADHYHIGISGRTNEEGANQMQAFLQEFGYSASTVPVKEILHLKTGAMYIGKNNILLSGEFRGRPEFAKYRCIDVDDDEAYAANALYINNILIMAKGYPKLKKALKSLDYDIIELEMSEYKKIDGSLTCLSLRF